MNDRFILAGLLAAWLLAGCIGGSKGTATNTTPPTPTVNTLALMVDSGPAAAPGAINRAYVTVKVCVAGSTTQCTNIDHVLLDTGSWGLRLVRSVLTAGAVMLVPETDAQGQTIQECAGFSGGFTWGPVATADVTLAGEIADKLPVQIMDDTMTGAPAPSQSPCGGTSGSVHNMVSDHHANGLLGVGVFAADCGTTCVSSATPLQMYYGCTSAGICTAENVPVTSQVTNPVAMFAADNNGVIVDLPSLQNANGDLTVQGQLIFGLGTQADNSLPATNLTVLGADANGDFTATYNGGTTVLPALIDSGTDSDAFNDPTINTCMTNPPPPQVPSAPQWVGYDCPSPAPLSVFAVNASAPSSTAVATSGSSKVDFAVADPNSFVANATAFIELAGGGGSTNFIWGMPFFYGQKIYIGIDGRTSGSFKGPYYAY